MIIKINKQGVACSEYFLEPYSIMYITYPWGLLLSKYDFMSDDELLLAKIPKTLTLIHTIPIKRLYISSTTTVYYILNSLYDGDPTSPIISKTKCFNILVLYASFPKLKAFIFEMAPTEYLLAYNYDYKNK